jgi:YHS domain-containing protein
MNSKKRKFGVVFLLAGLLIIGLIASGGCKKKSEPAAPPESEEVASAIFEQKICPVMEGAINKNIFTEYKGKKVYFCCAGCKEKFEKEPEKYIAKLPQFKD